MMLFILVGIFLLEVSFVRAVPSNDCMPTVELINQDPYPANPGEYVKTVFEIGGLSNPDCKSVSFEIKEDFPFSLNPGATRKFTFSGNAYVKDYSTTALAPYELRVDKDAIDGNNKIEALVTYIDSNGNTMSLIKEFEINVNGVKVDFSISIKDFDSTTNTLTFEILNIGEDNVVGLTADIPKQDNVIVKGTNREIIGELDANDDTTFNYEALPKDGEIALELSYTDTINERRHMEKKVYYDSSYFTDRKASEVQPKSIYYYLFWGLLVIIVIRWVWVWRRNKKKKEKERRESERKR